MPTFLANRRHGFLGPALRWSRLAGVLTVLGWFCSGLAAAEARVSFGDSVAPVPKHMAAGKRELVKDDELQTLDFSVALRMRDFAGLQARVARGEVISRAELERSYLPSKADYAAVVGWLKGQGFQIVHEDTSRLSVFARGRLPQITQSLQVHLSTVTDTDGRKYHAADTAPSLPASLAGPVLGINHLQPYHRRQKHAIAHSLTANQPPYLIGQVLTAYRAKNLGVTGAGQTIAILIDTVPLVSDVTTFWTTNNIAQSASNLEFVNVNNVTLPATSGEETLDVEWTSGIAPGAKIRVYAAGSLANSALDLSLQRIIDDLPSRPDLHVLSISLGEGENQVSQAEFATDAQYFATLASAGVSVFVSSGDGGSTPSTVTNNNTGTVVQVESYASDPSVTGVGGTSITVDATTGLRTSESAWNGAGGGVSTQYGRPVWQTGAGVPAGTKRCVPDVALIADPNTGVYVTYNGAAVEYGGTSVAAPIWAGFCALIDEARARQGYAPMGLANPRLYPLLGTAAFVDITTGNNASATSGGLYSATAGYDQVTGIGVPNMDVLLPALVGQPPIITTFSPASAPVYATVRVIGTDLGSATTVKVGGVAVPFTVVNNSLLTFTVSPGMGAGAIAITTPAGVATTSGILAVTAVPATSVVISQVYCEGGSNYQNDFVELFNAGSTTVNLSTWSVQMTGAASRRWTVVKLTGTLAPAHHYLVSGGNFGGGGATLPTPDVAGTFSLDSSTGEKVALVNTQTALTTTNPAGTSTVVDLVGYGTANGYEGTGAAALTTDSCANFRVGGGRSDTNDNRADFYIDTANPRNSASTTTPSAWPDLAPTLTHAASFTQGDPAQSYVVTVTNVGAASTGGVVSIAATVPAGLVATALAGDGWSTNLAALTATRSDVLAAGSAYPPLVLTVSVSATAPASVTPTVVVSASGDLNTANNTAADSTAIAAMTPSQSWRYIYFGSTANSGAGADTAVASGDGLPNLLKYALGLNPLVPTTTASVITQDATTGYLRLTVTKNPAATDVTFAIVGTTDLTNSASWSTANVVVDQNTSTILQAHSSTPVSSGSSFLRLVVTRP